MNNLNNQRPSDPKKDPTPNGIPERQKTKWENEPQKKDPLQESDKKEKSGDPKPL